MNQINFDPWMNMEQQRRHEKVLKEAAQNRLAHEGSQSEMLHNRGNSKILALVRKELANLGIKRQERDSAQSESDVSLRQ